MMKLRLFAFGLLLAEWLLSSWMSRLALARPEYAAKEKLDCTACHVTPWGGGPRNIFGKAYGSHGQEGSLTAGTDLFYGDLRTIAYFPLKQTTAATNGLAVMEAAATADVPVVRGTAESAATPSELRLVATYNMAPLSGSELREGYARFRLGSEPGHPPTDFLVGHFYVPFGLLTDEHRTYTRIQTNMTLNNYDTGVALATNLTDEVHLDLALVNDFQTGGSFSSGALTWGGVLNLRWNPASLPFLLGASGNYEHTTVSPAPYAGSLYAALSLDRLTGGKLGGAVLLESVLAKNWNNPSVNTGLVNPSLTQFFIPPSASDYQGIIVNTASLGNVAQLKLNLSQRWLLIYKFDFIALNSSDLGANYARHGFGTETFLNSNLILDTRFEFASAPRNDIADSNVLAAQNDFFAMLRLWL